MMIRMKKQNKRKTESYEMLQQLTLQNEVLQELDLQEDADAEDELFEEEMIEREIVKAVQDLVTMTHPVVVVVLKVMHLYQYESRDQ